MGRVEFDDERPFASAMDAQCKALREQLGAFGYQCLCACAIYPRLRFSLSTYLVRIVAEELGRPNTGEEDLLALFRLPWFRRGTIPIALRVQLIADLDKRVGKAARAAIRGTLFTALADSTPTPPSGAVPLAPPPRSWGAMLNAYIDGAPAGAIERDFVFARFMKRRRLTMSAIARDRKLSRVLGRWAANLNGARPLALLLLGSALIVAAMTADGWLRPLLEHTETHTFQVPVATSASSTRTGRRPALSAGGPSGRDARQVPEKGLDPELECMAKAVLHEAGNQPRAGQVAVAEVILNRVNDPRGRFGRTICGVVMQPGQFFDIQAFNPRRDARWDAAVEVARSVIEGREPAAELGNLFFHRGRPFPAPPPAPPPPGVCSPGPYLVYFDFDKDEVTPAAAAILDQAVQVYASCGNAIVTVSGFTDRYGSDSYNVGLSQRMAGNVRAYLSGRGIPDGNITTEAFGESRPIVPTANGVREPQNRRVEVTFGPASP